MLTILMATPESIAIVLAAVTWVGAFVSIMLVGTTIGEGWGWWRSERR